MTQIHHPNQSYKACIEDKEQIYYFETGEKVEKDLIDTNTLILDGGCGLARDAFSFVRDGYRVV